MTVPEQPCEGETMSGRSSAARARKVYGALRSRLGRSEMPSSRGSKRRTVTGRGTLVVWLAPSTATAISVLRPTSPPRGW